MIHIYKLIGILLIPFIKLNVYLRILKGKESALRYKERFGIGKIFKKDNKKIIWIHAASIGEFKSANYFIESLYKKYTILVTTTTLSAANYAAANYDKKIIHQFAPFDVSYWVNNFLNNWQPSFIIWIESDLWPVTLNIIKKRKIKSILINLRISPKSYKRWRTFPNFYTQLLNAFDDILAQSELDQNRIQDLTKKQIGYIGNIKLIENIDTNQEYDSKKSIKNKDIITIMIASTHYNEESYLIPALKKILDENKKIRVIIAPRHIDRVDEIIRLCNDHKLKSTTVSDYKKDDPSILIVNSFGILQKYFETSDIVFLGGSLIEIGGHNPIEAARKKCAILTGRYVFNWQNIFDQMIQLKICIKINSDKDFFYHINRLVTQKSELTKMKNGAYTFAKKQFVDTAFLNEIINKHIGSI